jgi:hypothetical protein
MIPEKYREVFKQLSIIHQQAVVDLVVIYNIGFDIIDTAREIEEKSGKKFCLEV